MRFRLVPKSMILGDLERLIRTLAEKNAFYRADRKKWMKIDLYCPRHNADQWILVSRNIRYMQKFAGLPQGESVKVKRQWGCQRRHFWLFRWQIFLHCKRGGKHCLSLHTKTSKKAVLWQGNSTMRCRCKILYVGLSKFTVTSRGSPAKARLFC